MELFDTTAKQYYKRYAPLAERMRPVNLNDYSGHRDIFSESSPVSLFLNKKTRPSIIFWGPPGTGKTTLVNILARESDCHYIHLSAVHSGKKDLNEALNSAREQMSLYGRETILFIDEIHRFSKTQQDGMLNAVEKGYYLLFGATTENPSFEVISPLLSRCQVVVMDKLTEKDIGEIIIKALKDKERGLGKTDIEITDSVIKNIAAISDGDARKALNLLELAAMACAERSVEENETERRVIKNSDIDRGLDKRMVLYDKTGDEHYNLISALIKSVRGSDPDAAVYYLARIIAGGEDPMFICRRMSILASEDVGLADPQAAVLASSITQSVKLIGMPESRILLSQLVIYLAMAPKSNSAYSAVNQALAYVRETGNLPVPKKILNAPTRLMKNIGYGQNYHYAHSYEGNFFPEKFLPDNLKGTVFYNPTRNGFENNLAEKLEQLNQQIIENNG